MREQLQYFERRNKSLTHLHKISKSQFCKVWRGNCDNNNNNNNNNKKHKVAHLTP